VPQAPLMPIATNVERLSSVVAAGFPGIVTQADTAFTRLIQQGDISAVPQTVLTSGEVSSIQADQMSQRVTHTAAIAQGNSGGPLVDRCGRVVGVNSFRLPDRQMLASAFYALGPETLLTFLRANGISPATTADPCQPPAISITAPPLQMPQATPQQAPQSPAQRPATAPQTTQPAQPQPAAPQPTTTPAQTPPAATPPATPSATPTTPPAATPPAAPPAARPAAPTTPATPPPPATTPASPPVATPPATPPASTAPATPPPPPASAPPAASPTPAAPAAPRN
jgi:Trypsin-like peptidase domain